MTVIRNILFGNSQNLDRKGYIWNMVSSMMDAGVSFVLLLVVTRMQGTEDAGIFAFSLSNAQMFLTIGYYGMRNYQVTDHRGKYKFDDYLSSRIITTLLMLLIGGMFVLRLGDDVSKPMVVIALCLLKMADSMEDVFGGYYQMKGRLDVAGKIWTMRMLKYIVVFTVALFISKDLLVASMAAVLISWLFLFILHLSVKKKISWSFPGFRIKRVFQLLAECFPLCAGAFVFVYIGNIPKFAINKYLSGNTQQAYYNYLFMPCFVISLLIGMLLRPALPRMTAAWNKDRHKGFGRILTEIFGITIVLSIIVLIGGYFLGCFVLGLFYGEDLSQFQNELMVLLIGGSLFACVSVIQNILTIMRFQGLTIFAYLLACFVGNIFAPKLVQENGIMGGALTYVLIVTTILLCYLVITLIYFIRERLQKKKIGD